MKVKDIKQEYGYVVDLEAHRRCESCTYCRHCESITSARYICLKHCNIRVSFMGRCRDFAAACPIH